MKEEVKERARNFVKQDIFLNSIPFLILTLTEDMGIGYCNDAYAQFFGKKASGLIGRNLLAALPEFEGTRSYDAYQKALKTSASQEIEEKYQDRYLHTKVYRMSWGLLAVAYDITEQKRTEEALKQFKRDYQELFESAHDAIIVFRPEDEVVLDVNQRACEMYGFDQDEFIGMSQERISKDIPGGKEHIKATLKKGFCHHFETTHYKKDGSEILLEINASVVNYKNQQAILSINRDITERKRSEETLRQSEGMYRALIEASPEAVTTTDLEGNITFVSRQTLKLHGYQGKDELLGKSAFELIAPEERVKAMTNLQQTLKEGSVKNVEYTFLRKDGTRFNAELTTALIRNSGGNPDALIAITRDITERKQAEKALRESEDKYRTLVEQSLEGIAIIQDFHAVFVNPAFAEISGYTVDELASLSPEGVRGLVHPEDQSLVWGRMRERLEGKDVPDRYEYRGIRKDGNIRWLEMFVQVIEFNGRPAIQGTFVDITERKVAEKELQESLGKMEKTIDNTLQAMAKILETRDPYTGGHQQRVAKLAVAVAEEMELNEDQIRGLQVAALIHDIGKIYVPAEILTRPAVLTDPEFALIKSHPKIGFGILETIDFPWPVAKIVLQHHERWDGSGYPQGLKDGEIMLEARILAVADVVEAMSSHRPYRPARTLEATLEEISNKKGILYDPSVVDACLEVISKRGFQFYR